MPTDEQLRKMTPEQLRAALKEAKMAEELAKWQNAELRSDNKTLAAGQGGSSSWSRCGMPATSATA